MPTRSALRGPGAYEVFGDARFERLSRLSPSHLYNPAAVEDLPRAAHDRRAHAADDGAHRRAAAAGPGRQARLRARGHRPSGRPQRRQGRPRHQPDRRGGSPRPSWFRSWRLDPVGTTQGQGRYDTKKRYDKPKRTSGCDHCARTGSASSNGRNHRPYRVARTVTLEQTTGPFVTRPPRIAVW